ncbi:MAG: helix-turn-helix transcriptional regulator [Synergistaceae bacterium]|nr:helix-turn-helix transcriptional regulator [Synergistaceae bacterium]MBR1602964.1 helix-turn-helix transcriptional regulator [Synergistaceae bacterium]
MQRKECGLTQEELAAKINVSVMSIRRWEWGENCPRSDELQRLAEALGTTSAYLLGEVDTPQTGVGVPYSETKRIEPERVQQTSTINDKGTLRYKFSNGQEIEVPATPEYAPQFWARVDRLIGLQPQATAAV